MPYNTRPKMVLFDVGGTLFDDGKCVPVDGLAALRREAENPDVTDDRTLAELWDEYMHETSGLKSKSGITLDMPLSAPIRYVTMRTGLHFSISMPAQEEIFDRFNSTRSVISGIPELLATIESLGIRAAVISNNAMSGDGLSLAVKHWIPTENMEFFLTSADILFAKPSENIFHAATAYADLQPSDCWYCGDGFIPDVCGGLKSGLSPILLDPACKIPLEMRSSDNGEYMAVNCWQALEEHLKNL